MVSRLIMYCCWNYFINVGRKPMTTDECDRRKSPNTPINNKRYVKSLIVKYTYNIIIYNQRLNVWIYYGILWLLFYY